MKAVLLTALGALVLVAGTASPVPLRAGDDAQAELTERVEKLERLVQRNPYQPRETVLARLDAVEVQLKTLADESSKSTRQQARDDTQLDRTLQAMQRDLRDLDRRLKSLETAQRRATSDQDLRTLKTQLQALDRAVNDLKTRVSKLESRR